ncbi:hypothetical protein [Methylosinus sp. LW4]|uniref:hypothetical protein n=1 Tax=Methylosinus sp. LW4 TaxID=136993 RepID=UPI0003676F62|nr:hypothetical protein [Methylosinus sp. LW4]
MTAALAAELAQIKDRLNALLDLDPGPVLRARILAARQAVAAARDVAFLEEPRPAEAEASGGDVRDMGGVT